MTTTASDVLFTDIPALVAGKFKPASGLGRGWVAADYSTADFSGVGIATTVGADEPESGQIRTLRS